MDKAVDEIHNKAIEFADEALLAKRRGNLKLASSFYEKAYYLERKAALSTIVTDDQSQLYRSILLRSAATLAMKNGLLSDGENLVQVALTTNPHPAILPELEEILKEISNLKKEISEIEIIGVIISADAIANELKVLSVHNNQMFKVFVPSEMLLNIVKSFWAENVVIQGTTGEEGIIFLEKIDKAA